MSAVVAQLAAVRALERGLAALFASEEYSSEWPGAPVPQLFEGGEPTTPTACCAWVGQLPEDEEAGSDSTCMHETVSWSVIVYAVCRRSERQAAVEGCLAMADAVRAVALCAPTLAGACTATTARLDSASAGQDQERKWTCACAVEVRCTRADAHAPASVSRIVREAVSA